MTEQEGRDYHNLVLAATAVKEIINQAKVELGLILDELQAIHSDSDDFGTYRELLATLHLNMGRTVPLIRNARWIKKCNVPAVNWRLLDSAVIDKLRTKKKNPNDYIDDIKGGVSYSDL